MREVGLADTGHSAQPNPRKGGTFALAAVLLLCLAPPRSAQASTLFDDLGGRSGVDRIVDGVVTLYMTDPRLRADFDNINPDRLKSRLATYLCMLTDGPCTYKGRSMAASHKGLKIDQASFDAVAEDTEIVMTRDGISNWTQNRLMARLAPLAHQIITR